MCGMMTCLPTLSSFLSSGDEIRRVMMEAVIPLVTGLCMRKKGARSQQHGKCSHAEVFLSVYDEFDDYLEMVIQFGVSSGHVVSV